MWTNGDTPVAGAVAAVDEPVQQIAVPADESDDDYQVIAKKPKTTTDLPMPSVSVPTTAVGHVAADVGDAAPSGDELKDVKVLADDDQGPVNDADWLRSRTNRVLDFVEDDEVPPSAKLLAPKLVELREAAPAAIATPTAAQQPDREVSPAAAASLSESDKVRDTGRLFLRNLNFDVSEDDLREHFSQYGALEEVIGFLSLFLAHSPYDEYPNRDNRCFANAVNRERILVDVSLV
jgi:multiple RNA-binding domain-containing protein 1